IAAPLRLEPEPANLENGELKFVIATDQATAPPSTVRVDPAHGRLAKATEIAPQTVISFDVEEHYRIEAAAGLKLDPRLKAHYCDRLEPSTRWLLDHLEKAEVKATFF